MSTNKNAKYDNAVAMGSDFLDRTVSVIDKVQRSKIVKAAGVILAVGASLLVLGGVFRVLAWTMAGWNQFASVYHKK